jgi:hypothetical protein
MIGLKILVAMSTILVGAFYNRNELQALVKCVTEKDYVTLYELNKTVAKREGGLY